MPNNNTISDHPSGYALAPGYIGFWSIVKPNNTVVNLNDYIPEIIGYTGAGQNPFENIRSKLGLSGGSFYQRTTDGEREIVLICILRKSSLLQIMRTRQEVINQLTHDNLTQTAQSLKLRYQYVDECGEPLGKILEVPVIFNGGLGGEVTGRYQDRFSLQFLELNPPSIKEITTNTVTVFPAATLLNGAATNGAANRTPDGTFSVLSTLSNISAFIEDLSGNLVIATDTTIFRASPAISQAVNGVINDLGVDAAGKIYAVGNNTTPQNRAMRYDGSSWTAVGSGWNGAINTIARRGDGKMLLAGNYTAPHTRSTVYDPDANTIAPYLTVNGAVNKIKMGPDGVTAYLCGKFTDINGTTCNGVAKHSVAGGLAALGTGIDVSSTYVVNDIAFKKNGNLVAVGFFVTAGGVTCQNIAEWDGKQWKRIGTDPLNTPIVAIYIDENDLIHVLSDNFASLISTYSVSFGYAIWNGNAWVSGDISFTSGLTPTKIFRRANGDFVWNSTRAIASKTFTVNYTGTAGAGVKFVLPPTPVSPTPLVRLDNYTTKKSIFFGFKSTVLGETITVTLDENGITLTSSVRGNLNFYVLPGSNVSTFGLVPGTNILAISNFDRTYNPGYALQYVNTHNSFDAAVV